VCHIDVVIVLLLPPRSVIGSLDEVKIWSMVSRLPSGVNKIMVGQGSMGKPRLNSYTFGLQSLICNLSYAHLHERTHLNNKNT